MNRSLVAATSAFAVVAVFSAAVIAQDMRPDRAIKYRQGIMQAQGWQMGVLSRMAKGEIPYNKDQAVRAATFVNELVKMPWEGFVPVSDSGNTKAKPEIWKDKAKFDKFAQEVQAETPKLVAAANSGDVAQLRAAVGAVGKACNNCHDDFQKQ
ncbi:MAG: cytochrome c [Burkholderiales bacterium]